MFWQQYILDHLPAFIPTLILRGEKMIKATETQKNSCVITVRLGIVFTLLVSLLGFVAASAAGETWEPLGNGANADIYALLFDSNGTLYAGGSFTIADGATSNHIAKWSGIEWLPVGSGMNADIYALVTDSSGNLYAGGAFTTAGGISANRIAKWDGTSWSSLGSGMNADIYALAFDSNGDLYAGGSFTTAGGISANRVAKWDGTSWSTLESGVGGRVNALAFDSHGNLFAGGSFTSPANRIAKWDGTSWSALSTGTSSTVRALVMDSSGNLYAGGSFVSANGTAASHIAKWDGTSWLALGSGTNADIYALLIDSDGILYAGGDFTTAGGALMNRVAKWDGSTWSPLESGMNDMVRTLLLDSNNAMYAGGDFTSAGGVTANHVALWAMPSPGTDPTPTFTPTPPPTPDPTSEPTPPGTSTTSIIPATNSSLFCTGDNTIITINLSGIDDLFGYQFIVHYNPSLVSASAAFRNAFFDTSTNATIPTNWNASCSNGECKFAVSKIDPGAPVTGSGIITQITLTGISTGTFNLTISDDILTDRDAQAIDHVVDFLPLTVCGYANVSGTVSLQGRTTPVNAGLVTLTDLGGIFGPYTTNFNPTTGNFTINNVKVMPAGSDYQFDAAHGLYLGNRFSRMLQPLNNYSAPNTRLLGGDANNDGLIDISDLTCIGGSFGSAPVTCGTTGSSDSNADGVVNILDLVLPGSNYGLASPRTW
jgi:hypothetical protein